MSGAVRVIVVTITSCWFSMPYCNLHVKLENRGIISIIMVIIIIIIKYYVILLKLHFFK
jgi:hypothetical protein